MTTTRVEQSAGNRDAVQSDGSRPDATTASRTEFHRAVHGWLQRHSITLLRISMGAVILGFGVLKYFPGVSPAEDLILTVTHLLTFGLVPGRLAMVLLATVECTIGLSLITGRGLRVVIYLLVPWVLGILSPAVLLPGRMFSGPDHAPTLEGQYVLKDVLLLTAALVIAATIRPGQKADDSSETLSTAADSRRLEADQRSATSSP